MSVPAEQFDMDAGVAELGAGLGFGDEVEDNDEITLDVQGDDDVVIDEPDVDENETVTPEVTAKAPPKSWAKEKHEVWGKLPPDAQDYIELREKQILDGIAEYKESATYGNELKRVIEPYRNVLTEAGINESQAISHLMRAHVSLTQGTREQRLAAYQELGRTIGLGEVDPNQKADPNLSRVEQEVMELKQNLTRQQQVQREQEQAKLRSEVDAFAEQNPYFDEVADDVAIFIKGGLSLQEAYDKAVWANPVTRQKEQDRLFTEKEEARKKKAAEEVQKAQKAKGSNVNGRDTSKAPTEPKGKMFDDMTNILEDIKNRH